MLNKASLVLDFYTNSKDVEQDRGKKDFWKQKVIYETWLLGEPCDIMVCSWKIIFCHGLTAEVGHGLSLPSSSQRTYIGYIIWPFFLGALNIRELSYLRNLFFFLIVRFECRTGKVVPILFLAPLKHTFCWKRKKGETLTASRDEFSYGT